MNENNQDKRTKGDWTVWIDLYSKDKKTLKKIQAVFEDVQDYAFESEEEVCGDDYNLLIFSDDLDSDKMENALDFITTGDSEIRKLSNGNGFALGINCFHASQPEPTLFAAIARANSLISDNSLVEMGYIAYDEDNDKWVRDDVKGELASSKIYRVEFSGCGDDGTFDVNDKDDFLAAAGKSVQISEMTADFDWDDSVDVETNIKKLNDIKHCCKVWRWEERSTVDGEFYQGRPLKDFDFKSMKNKPDKDGGLSKDGDLSK